MFGGANTQGALCACGAICRAYAQRQVGLLTASAQRLPPPPDSVRERRRAPSIVAGVDGTTVYQERKHNLTITRGTNISFYIYIGRNWLYNCDLWNK